AMLLSLESIRKAEPSGPPPALAELLPHFEWDAVTKSWGDYAARFLKRSRSGLQLGIRKHLWKEGEGHMARLGDPSLAPDALLAHWSSPTTRAPISRCASNFRRNRNGRLGLCASRCCA